MRERGEDKGEGWVDDDTTPQEMEFTAVPGFRRAMPTTPLGFIQLFITSELLMYVVEETNKYAEYCREILKRPFAKMWKECNMKDFANYLGLSMLMGVIRCPSLRMYWSRSPVFGHKLFPQIMNSKKYIQIGKHLHTFNLSSLLKRVKKESKQR